VSTAAVELSLTLGSVIVFPSSMLHIASRAPRMTRTKRPTMSGIRARQL
jgi:hypothetical protein